MSPPDAFAPLTSLWQKVDEFFDRVRTRYPNALACQAGCSSCCAPGLSVTAVEADAILRSLATSTPARRAELSAMVRDASAEVRPVDAQRCVALRADETCAIYEARPMVCRSHGLVHRFREPDERRRLPLVDACEKNFRSQALAEIDADCIVDQVTLSTLLAAVDARFAAQTGTERGRIALSALLLGDDRSKIF